MMKFLFCLLSVLCLPFLLHAQSGAPCVSCFGQNPSTVTITDPARYNDIVPCSASTGIPTYQQFYQRNRFKWYENVPGGDWEFKIKTNDIDINGNYLVRSVTSPFVDAAVNGSVKYLNNLLKENFVPDNLPADGWELIRQDFGFANYNNIGPVNSSDNLTSTVEGSSSQIQACPPVVNIQGNPCPPSPNLLNMCARPSNQINISYLVLYNKYFSCSECSLAALRTPNKI